MASNKDLIVKIHTIAIMLGSTQAEADEATADKNNEELTKLLATGKAVQKQFEADEEAAAEAKADEEAEAKAGEKPEYYVEAGKSVSCRKGIRVEGDEMRSEYLGGGEESLKALVKSGVVIDRDAR